MRRLRTLTGAMVPGIAFVVVALTFVGLTLVWSQTDAHAKCDQNSDVFRECEKGLSDALRNMPQGDSKWDVSRRVKRGEEAVRNCLTCALDSTKDGMERFSPDSDRLGVSQ